MSSAEIGPFPVVASAEDAAAFRSAIGAPSAGATLPLTFPMRWLAAADVRAALLDLAGDEAVLVHESQSFSYSRPLQVAHPYALRLAARRGHAPERLILDGTISDAAGMELARLETVLRLVALPDGTGS